MELRGLSEMHSVGSAERSIGPTSQDVGLVRWGRLSCMDTALSMSERDVLKPGVDEKRKANSWT